MYCSIGENHLRMDCKYALPQESPEPFCKYTQGERLLDTTDPDEEQHAPFKNRAKARLFPGNICRLLFKNLPNGKSNFTCNIKQAESGTATKTSVVEKSKLPLLAIVPPQQSASCYFMCKNTTSSSSSYCSAPPPLLSMECPIPKLQWPAADLDDTTCAAGNPLAVRQEQPHMFTLHPLVTNAGLSLKLCVCTRCNNRN